MKIKTVRLSLELGLGLLTAVAVAVVITGCKSGPFSSDLNGSPTSDFHYAQSPNYHSPPYNTPPPAAPTTNDLGMPISN
jgi:hypothetical protein